ncbi:putative HTH-type transcriptional regulator YybR [Chryseobacterium oranimense G311]|uniref:winged helix-turn-helix transcriptional regulator n=1 Tax=Chryseobacterium oranimense TaxID=421058 RepID=UPI0005338C37|nr:helix-turn-helix domain-containing protein [Chryseobacterium oranimense]CEJ68147.1 putative HTH-type transcriptional regulator YybR [Chryseobacterium oranimense G311]
MKEIKTRSSCPLSYSLDFFGDKWSLLIIRDLIFNNKSTYSDFLTSDEKIATNILADRLQMLQTNGFITKQKSEDKKSKFTFLLTEKGIDLVPVILEFGLWGSIYNPPGLDENLITSLKNDRERTINDIKARLREKIEDKAKTENVK